MCYAGYSKFDSNGPNQFISKQQDKQQKQHAVLAHFISMTSEFIESSEGVLFLKISYLK